MVRGKMVDRYGREFILDMDRMEKARKPLSAGGRVWKANYALVKKNS